MTINKYQRINYYLTGVLRDLAPYAYFQKRREAFLSRIDPDKIPCRIKERVNYYNKMRSGHYLKNATRIRGISIGGSYYYYDLKRHAKLFGPELKLAYLFGDVIHVPEEPTIVKSRPVDGENSNSVIMKLDSLRHFTIESDKREFHEKLPAAVWRGILNNPARIELVRRYGESSGHNIGAVDAPLGGIQPKTFMSIYEQLAYRYVISIEGNDVATNLKWVLASQSLCLMPRPRFETWFMEGTLKPGVHYVELRRDLADLEDKIIHYEKNPEEAIEIIANANAHWRKFTNLPEEDLISVFVLQKYFENTGQITPLDFSTEIFSD